MCLLDTDVPMDIQREYAPALTWFATLTELPAVPGLVVMELIQDAQNAHQVRQALKLVAPLPVVWPTAVDCQRALTDCIAYHLSHSLGLLEALIAACTMGVSAPLCTCNVKHYRVVPGLVMVQPYTRRLSMWCGVSGRP
jgi:predicted nucleic acid-binding protein